MDPHAPEFPDELDLDKWIDGTCGLTKSAKIYQRGDLITKIDQIEQELEIARKVPADQRGINDKTPDALKREWEQAAEELMRSALIVHVQDRTEERRRRIREGLTKKGLDPAKQEDSDTIVLHLIADAIVTVEVDGKTRSLEPEGFPPEKLRAIRDKIGDSGLMDVRDTFFKVVSEAPTVSAPLSRSSSSNRGGIT